MARNVSLHVTITDDKGNKAVVDAQGVFNELPVIDGVDIVQVGATLQVTIRAHDPEGGVLTYELIASEGTVAPGPQPNVFIWTP